MFDPFYKALDQTTVGIMYFKPLPSKLPFLVGTSAQEEGFDRPRKNDEAQMN